MKPHAHEAGRRQRAVEMYADVVALSNPFRRPIDARRLRGRSRRDARGLSGIVTACRGRGFWIGIVYLVLAVARGERALTAIGGSGCSRACSSSSCRRARVRGFRRRCVRPNYTFPPTGSTSTSRSRTIRAVIIPGGEIRAIDDIGEVFVLVPKFGKRVVFPKRSFPDGGREAWAFFAAHGVAGRTAAPQPCGTYLAHAVSANRALGDAVSTVGLGSWLTYGGSVEEATARACMRRAYELGVTFFDTANVYARGRAEEVVGRAIKDFARDSIVLATKVYFPMGDGPNDRGLSRKHIRMQIDASLRRLDVEYVDLYQCHRYDEDTPLDETCGAMNDLVRTGKILYWGVSEWNADQITAACTLARENGWAEPISNQPQYSALWRHVAARRLSGVPRIRSGQRRVVAARARHPHRQVHLGARRAAGHARRIERGRHDGGLLHAAGARRGAAAQAAGRTRRLHDRATRARVVLARCDRLGGDRRRDAPRTGRRQRRRRRPARSIRRSFSRWTRSSCRSRPGS